MIRSISSLRRQTRFFYALLIAIFVLYVFRGATNKLRLDYVPYVFTCLVILLCFCSTSFRFHYYLSYSLLIVCGVISVFFSVAVFVPSITAVLIGFYALFSNLIVWVLFFNTLEKSEYEIVIDSYKKMIIVFAVLSSLLGVYQTVVDASIFGMAMNEIYGSNELMSSGVFVRRATALIGSSQNYGLFIGVGLCLALFSDFKYKFLKWFCVLCIFIGILVSGSRAASLSIFLSLICYVISTLKIKYITPKQILIWIVLILGLCFGAIVAVEYINTDTLMRLISFNLSSAAISAYLSSVSGITPLQLLVGRGVGFHSWPVYSLLGSSSYALIYGSEYQSIESTFLFLFTQVGLVGWCAFLIIIAKALVGSSKKGLCDFTPILLMTVNFIFTPSFTGMSMSFVLWPLIIYASSFSYIGTRQGIKLYNE